MISFPKFKVQSGLKIQDHLWTLLSTFLFIYNRYQDSYVQYLSYTQGQVYNGKILIYTTVNHLGLKRGKKLNPHLHNCHTPSQPLNY